MKNPLARILFLLSFLIMIASVVIVIVKKSGLFVVVALVMLVICGLLIKDASNEKRVR